MPFNTPFLLLLALSPLVMGIPVPTVKSSHPPTGFLNALNLKTHGRLDHFTVMSKIRNYLKGGSSCEGNTHYFKQTLDKFDATNSGTYRQRYFVNEAFVKEKGGPVFLYIGGEGPLSTDSVCSGFHVDLAKKHGALIVAVEHRFYGTSQPFLRLKTENLKYLTATHAIADLINMIDYINDKFDVDPAKWIAFGGSYPGALAAYIRNNFPEAIAGSVASSAPVKANTDFFSYERIGVTGASKFYPECMSLYNRTMDVILPMLSSDEGKSKFQSYFNPCSDITTDPTNAGTMMYIDFPDVGGYMQYYLTWVDSSHNNIETFCSSFMGSDPNPKDLMANFKRYLMDNQFYTGQCLFNDFDTVVTQNTGMSAQPFNYRAWFWQKCSQFGYFRTEAGTDNNDAFYKKLCAASYGIDVYPDTEFWNTYYGGNNNNQDRIYFVNGMLDGWHGLSVLSPNVEEQYSRIAPNASHCEDMYGFQFEGTPEMHDIHLDIEKKVLSWVGVE